MHRVVAIVVLPGSSPAKARNPQAIFDKFRDIAKDAERARRDRKAERKPVPERVDQYTLGGVTLGQRSELPRDAGYTCSPSEQFANFTGCQAASFRGNPNVRAVFLRTPDGTVAYVSELVSSWKGQRMDLPAVEREGL